MSYPSAVNYSKGQIDRAGQALATQPENSKDYEAALELVNTWRASHSYPMNTFVSTLHHKTRKNKNVIIAQRLKRLPTIINKTKRFKDMKLSRMQDVGGVRAILKTLDEVESLQKQYVDKGRFTHILKRHKDYIQSPKEDGYRGIHLVYEYNNTLARNNIAPLYKGLSVEVQIRTSLQHSWATAVEAMGTFLGDSFKNGAGSEQWKEFFALTSSAFANVEKRPTCPQHTLLNPLEVLQKIRKLDKDIKALHHIQGVSAAANIIHDNLEKGSKKRHAHYSVISLDFDNRRVEVWSYRKEDLEKATQMYEDLEQRGDKFDQVLVSVNNLISLKEAYPNYFLDIRDFAKRVEIIIAELDKNQV